MEDEIASICDHLMGEYPAHEAIGISVSVLANMVLALESESKTEVLSQIYDVIDRLKYDEIGTEITH